ncbi:Gfo/Idh/MocA family protein [Tengunoibacter tsumagoiensis]|uniref:Dehydrogenase n=1 Tax=Tengunoibacter tsumagoiensis TaxID=2014871 RepID=A0A402A3Q4_9CHLR|nr:Gfo/Idh/MocA family oxidoreductase [Tengunoibacter tsumagoiensis]GCE13774.1 dehydrogenase [Tengunoibacter tsumagoiensis]
MTLRIIHVGLGGWGQSWAADVVAHNKEIETVAWVEVDAPTLAKAQERLKFPAESGFTSLQEALDTVDAEAVLITASLPGHVPSAVTALNANKHVLLEKPFAGSVQEAQQVVELAEQRNLLLMISQNYRHVGIARKAAELVKNQELGQVGVVNIDFRRWANVGEVGSNRHLSLWHPLLVDMSIHHFDLMRMVIGQEPVRVQCTTYSPSWSKFVEAPAAALTITFDRGAIVNYRGSWVSPAPQTNWAGEWHMECEGGEIFWTCRGEIPDALQLRPLGKRMRSLKVPELEYVDRSGTLNAFAQSVKHGAPLETSGRDNLKTLALMFGAIRSAEIGQPVDLTEPLPILN